MSVWILCLFCAFELLQRVNQFNNDSFLENYHTNDIVRKAGMIYFLLNEVIPVAAGFCLSNDCFENMFYSWYTLSIHLRQRITGEIILFYLCCFIAKLSYFNCYVSLP